MAAVVNGLCEGKGAMGQVGDGGGNGGGGGVGGRGGDGGGALLIGAVTVGVAGRRAPGCLGRQGGPGPGCPGVGSWRVRGWRPVCWMWAAAVIQAGAGDVQAGGVGGAAAVVNGGGV
ncbi:hypothetical protein OK115_05825 [Xylella fastidiosa subsp. fastidiosa]|nr:hypothetical protein OK115_05825 [Xylella fastidiosa subsp. fastidiosa]